MHGRARKCNLYYIFWNVLRGKSKLRILLYDERCNGREGNFDTMKEEKREETQAELELFYRGQLGIDDETILRKVVDASRIWDLVVGEVLIQEGVVPSHLYFLLHGVMRGVLLDNNGKDVTDCIACRPGETVMPDNDFDLPASVTMEVLEDSRVIALPLELVRELLADHPELMNIYKRFLVQSATMHRNLKIAVYQYDAHQRYEWFLGAYPGLIDRIPHKYIAGLLNMTPVTLSNVRKTLREKPEPEGAPHKKQTTKEKQKVTTGAIGW